MTGTLPCAWLPIESDWHATLDRYGRRAPPHATLANTHHDARNALAEIQIIYV